MSERKRNGPTSKWPLVIGIISLFINAFMAYIAYMEYKAKKEGQSEFLKENETINR
jgi:hypothetical protein